MRESYTQRAVTVRAFQVTRSVEQDLPDWLRNERVMIDKSADSKEPKVYGCCVRTPEGKMRAKVGDYIVLEPGDGPEGDLRVLKNSHFRRLYG